MLQLSVDERTLMGIRLRAIVPICERTLK